jgi:branched-chain amino acid transport system ATP-binding protein
MKYDDSAHSATQRCISKRVFQKNCVIANIRKSGIATLIVYRDYRKVLAQSDRALVLQKGQLVLQGSAEALATSPELSSYLGV